MHLLIVLLILWLAMQLQATDILYEHDWSRVVSGDRATRLTREIGEESLPTEISERTIQTILTTMGLSEQTAAQLHAWQKGIGQYGWAQQECEPEQATYRVTQLIVVKNGVRKIIARNYGLLGKTEEAGFDLHGKQLAFKKIEIPETLDRTVFYTVRSPALFVLNQEHFQKQFFEEMLNLNYPGLEKAKQAWQSKKTLLATQEVAEYFRRKKHPIWPQEKPMKFAVRDSAAEKVLRHEFACHDSTIYLGKRIDYRNNPTNENEWIWGLNRMNHWVTLLNGYLKTDNEAYAREYNAQVIDWTVRNPAPPFRLTRVPSWRNLEAGVRMANSWPKTFFAFSASSSFQTQAIQLMLASIWSHAGHIMRFPSGLRFVNNWVIAESNGLADVGMFYPEFQKADVWAKTGLHRLSQQLDKQVYPDGMQHELSTSYHQACMHSFYQAFDVAGKTGTPVPKNYARTLEKMFEYIMYVSTPLRKAPPTNDADRDDIRGWMKIGAEKFNRPDMLFIATNGASGRAPERTSVFFPWGGQSVMRSDWGSDAWYLFFDAGPTGVSHQHEDKLHIGVSAFGRVFLTDGGRGLYIPDKWRDYFLSTRAHNTIMIDGRGQLRIPLKKTHRVLAPLKNRWLSDEHLDFAGGTYSSGYGPQRIPVTHSRYVLFKKKEYWLVIDLLTGDGEHEFNALYHFMPCQTAVDEEMKSIRTQNSEGKNIQLVAAATIPLNIAVVQGQENPEQGWISTPDGKHIPAPTAIFKGRGKMPVLMATVIQPFRGRDGSNIKIEFQQSPSFQAVIMIHSDLGDDRWIVNLQNENRILVDSQQMKQCVSFSREKNGTTAENFSAGF